MRKFRHILKVAALAAIAGYVAFARRFTCGRNGFSFVLRNKPPAWKTPMPTAIPPNALIISRLTERRCMPGIPNRGLGKNCRVSAREFL